MTSIFNSDVWDLRHETKRTLQNLFSRQAPTWTLSPTSNGKGRFVALQFSPPPPPSAAMGQSTGISGAGDPRSCEYTSEVPAPSELGIRGRRPKKAKDPVQSLAKTRLQPRAGDRPRSGPASPTQPPRPPLIAVPKIQSVRTHGADVAVPSRRRRSRPNRSDGHRSRARCANGRSDRHRFRKPASPHPSRPPRALRNPRHSGGCLPLGAPPRPRHSACRHAPSSA